MGSRFSAPVQTGPVYTQPPIQWVPERDGNHPPPSSAEVKERVELYLYSLSGSLWLVGWRTLLALLLQ